MKHAKVKQGAGLHKHIATGGSPKTYKGTKGVNESTVPRAKKSK